MFTFILLNFNSFFTQNIFNFDIPLSHGFPTVPTVALVTFVALIAFKTIAIRKVTITLLITLTMAIMIIFLLAMEFLSLKIVTSFHHEILFLKSVRQKNSFPLFFIDKCIKKFLDKLLIKRKKKKEKDSSTKKEITISLEFLGKMSLQVKTRLIEIFHTCNKDIKLNVVFKSYLLECLMLFDLRIKYLNVLILYCYISSRATLAIVFTLVKPRDII